MILQLVTPGGVVAVNWGDVELLPVVAEPTLMKRGDRTFLVTTGAWPTTDGTVRLAHDVTAALGLRRGLLGSLITDIARNVAAAHGVNADVNIYRRCRGMHVRLTQPTPQPWSTRAGRTR